MMGELFGGAQANHARDPLERVEAAKEIIEQRAIDCAVIDLVFERYQRTADRDEVLITLGVVIVEELIEKLTTIVGVWVIHELAFSNEPTTSANCLGSKGLVKYRFAPAAKACVRLDSSPFVVKTTIGMFR